MQVILHPPFDTLWQGKNPFVAVEQLQGDVYRELAARRTLRTVCAGVPVFVKIHRGVGWGEIFKNWIIGRQPVLGADQELQAIQRLTALGVPTMEALAFGERGWNPAQRHSFIVTRELAPTESLEDHTARWREQRPAAAWKHALIARVAEMVATMHAGGVNHRDLYLCHFLLHLDPPPAVGEFRLSLIDLHRAQCRTTVPLRWRNKDLAGLYFSALNIGLTQRDFLRFLRAYFQSPLRIVLKEQSALLTYLEREGQRLLKRYQRKYAPGASS